MRISDWSSDVCSSDLNAGEGPYPDDLPVYEPADFVERYLRSHLPFVLARSDAIRTTVGGGIWPMAGFAALAGAGLVAAAASLWFRSEERRVGKERVSPGRSRWSPNH